MPDNPGKEIQGDRRSEPRNTVDEYHSVEFQPKAPGPLYQFKIRDISDHGLCILVKADSDLLNHLHRGDVIDMTYYPKAPGNAADAKKTKIVHITPEDKGKFKGHLLVGLSVIS